LSLVGCLENDIKKRVMITVPQSETLKHLSSQIGQLMQKYRIFENLLGLRASEIKVLNCQEKNKTGDLENNMSSRLFPYVFKKNKSSNENGVDASEIEEIIGDYLHDGDEFVFKLESFDKWIKVFIRFQLKSFPEIKFSAKLEMRVVGYFPNSHFFSIIQKLVIEVWNEAIESKRGKKDLYVLKSINFMNRKTVKERVDKETEDASKLLYSKAGSSTLIDFSNRKERTKIDINKKNYVEVNIDPEKKVDDTFGHDGCIVVDAVFNTLSHEVKSQNKIILKLDEPEVPIQESRCIVGCVILESSNCYQDENQDHGEDGQINQNTLKKINLITESGPFYKGLFKFNALKMMERKGSYIEMKDLKMSKKHSNQYNRIDDVAIVTFNIEESEVSRGKSRVNMKSSSPDLSLIDHTFLDNETPFMNNRYSVGSRSERFDDGLTDNSVSIDGTSPQIKLFDCENAGKEMKQIKIEPFVIKKNEYDILKIPETRGIKFRLDC